MSRPVLFGLLLVALSAAPVRAQQSANFKLTESVMNSGGDPQNGAFAGSATWRVKLDTLGEAASRADFGSASWRMDGGFVAVYRPPGEVQNLRWSSKTALSWSPERSVGKYELYRDLISTLPGNFGSCFASNLTSESLSDSSTPPSGRGWFYLVTARNRLEEEGTKGKRSNGQERPNPAPCP